VRLAGEEGRGGLTYEVLLPVYAAARLQGSMGQPVTLYTVYFIESLNQGASLVPRLAGFLEPEDRAFFELFTTCKGIGNRKALRAMSIQTSRIANAIADRDVAMLQSLPEIGRRTAETIVATLQDRVDAFVSGAAFGAREGGRKGVAAAAGPEGGSLAREALEVLMQLGENRVQAVMWIDQALRDEASRPGTAEEIVARVYRIKSGT
jgi:Holliday junction DNA helicase RuvA